MVQLEAEPDRNVPIQGEAAGFGPVTRLLRGAAGPAVLHRRIAATPCATITQNGRCRTRRVRKVRSPRGTGDAHLDVRSGGRPRPSPDAGLRRGNHHQHDADPGGPSGADPDAEADAAAGGSRPDPTATHRRRAGRDRSATADRGPGDHAAPDDPATGAQRPARDIGADHSPQGRCTPGADRTIRDPRFPRSSSHSLSRVVG